MNLNVSISWLKKYIAETAGTEVGNNTRISNHRIHLDIKHTIIDLTHPNKFSLELVKIAMILIGTIEILMIVLIVFFEKP